MATKANKEQKEQELVWTGLLSFFPDTLNFFMKFCLYWINNLKNNFCDLLNVNWKQKIPFQVEAPLGEFYKNLSWIINTLPKFAPQPKQAGHLVMQAGNRDFAW